MGKYLKPFKNHTDYEQYINSGAVVLPNVSYCINDNDMHYNPYVAPHDYSQDYLTTVALTGGTISFNIWKSMEPYIITSISYSTDNGETWTTTNNEYNEEVTISVNVSEGDKVLWKGDASQLGFYDYDYEEEYVGSFFSSDCEFNVQGNVMSMLYGDDFVGEETLEYDGGLAYLFSDYGRKHACLVVSAEHMVLPATTLADNCYSYMFKNCTNLTTAPSELPATTLANYCYQNMFYGCTSLVTAPELPATTLANYCYQNMFYGCTSLVIAPELPATTLPISCYKYMFYGCTSLVTAPELPATTLALACYQCMFEGCKSLVTAPELHATKLVDYCYYQMFSGCSSLNSITCLATSTSARDCTHYWVQNVAINGTFTKAAGMNFWAWGFHGIPASWTVQDYSE